MKVKKLVAFFVAIVLIFGCFGTVYAGDFKVANAEIQNQNGDEKQGTEEQGVPNAEPSGTPKPSASTEPSGTPKPSASAEPSETPKPSASAEPSETPKPSASAEPSETPKPSASATPKPSASATPKPSASATPSVMPKPTATSAVNGGQSNPFATVPVCDGIDVTKFNADGSQFHTGALNVRSANGISKVEFAIWSDASGGADVKWYNGNNYNNGCWGTVVDIANHGNHVGNYQIHVYGTDNSGNRVIIGHAIYKVEGDGKAPVCDGIDVTKFNADGSQFHTGALNVRDMSGVSKVEFAIWSDASGGADVKWYNGNNYNNGCWGTVVDIANHGNHIGNYQIHVYGTDGRGNRDVIGYALYKVEGDSKAPVCDGIDATKFNAAGTQFHIGALNVRDMSGVSKVEFAVWSDASGGADIKWYNGNNYNNGSWGAVVDVANHGRRTGKYQIHAYGTDGKGNRDLMGYVVYTADFDTSPPKMSSIAVSQYDAAGRYAQITLSGVTDPSGVAATRVAVWSNASGGADLKWMNLTSWGNDTWGGLLDTKEFGFADGTYNVHAYGTDGYGNDGLMGTGAFYVTPTEITYSTITVESWAYFDGIVINDPWCNYGISEMYMYVTSAATGPNNGIYYDMKNNGDFFWAGNVYFNDVRGYTYHIDVVLVDKRGAHHLVESADVK